jgi:hypothetical protein
MTDKAICLQCKQEFDQKSYKQKYCKFECQEKAQYERSKKKKEELQTVIKKIAWRNTELGKYEKFISIFEGFDLRCSLCNISMDEHFKENSIPLFAQLKLGIRNYSVMNINSWDFFCLKCWTQILIESKKN